MLHHLWLLTLQTVTAAFLPTAAGARRLNRQTDPSSALRSSQVTNRQSGIFLGGELHREMIASGKMEARIAAR